jgi:hypothetical protein
MGNICYNTSRGENMSTDNQFKSNTRVVIFFLVISLLYTGFKVGTNMIENQSEMLLKDYLPIMISGFGIIALLVSVLTNKKIDTVSIQKQIFVLTCLGMIFMPFTIILFVFGIMKYIENNSFKLQFFGGTIFGMIIFGTIISSIAILIS